MAIQMNVGDHTSPHPGWVPVPFDKRGQVNWARARAKVIARDFATADRYFTTLPNGRSLSNLLADSSIWINYDP